MNDPSVYTAAQRCFRDRWLPDATANVVCIHTLSIFFANWSLTIIRDRFFKLRRNKAVSFFKLFRFRTIFCDKVSKCVQLRLIHRFTCLRNNFTRTYFIKVYVARECIPVRRPRLSLDIRQINVQINKYFSGTPNLSMPFHRTPGRSLRDYNGRRTL